MDAAYLFGIGIILYLASDRALDATERRIGRRLEHRTGVFFLILLGSALATFWLIHLITGK